MVTYQPGNTSIWYINLVTYQLGNTSNKNILILLDLNLKTIKYKFQILEELCFSTTPDKMNKLKICWEIVSFFKH